MYVKNDNSQVLKLKNGNLYILNDDNEDCDLITIQKKKRF